MEIPHVELIARRLRAELRVRERHLRDEARRGRLRPAIEREGDRRRGFGTILHLEVSAAEHPRRRGGERPRGAVLDIQLRLRARVTGRDEVQRKRRSDADGRYPSVKSEQYGGSKVHDLPIAIGAIAAK